MAKWFRNHIIQIPVRQMNFSIYFPNNEKLKSFVEHFLHIIKYFFRGTVIYVQYGFLFLKITMPKLSVKLPTRHCGCANRKAFNFSYVLRHVSKIIEKAWLSWVQFEAPIPGSELGAEAREILLLLQVGWELAKDVHTFYVLEFFVLEACAVHAFAPGKHMVTEFVCPKSTTVNFSAKSRAIEVISQK